MKLNLLVGMIFVFSTSSALAQGGMRISPNVEKAARGEGGGPHAGTERPDRAPAAAAPARSAATPAPRASATPAPRSADDKAIEKAEKAADKLTEVRSRPHTAAEEGKAFKEAAEAKQAAEKQLAKP